MRPRFCYWSPAANRHLEPFLDEAFRNGALVRVAYLEGNLPAEQQLGTMPARRGAQQETVLATAPDWRRAAVELVRTPCDAHVFYGMGATLEQWSKTAFVMAACARARVPYVFFGESLQPRARLELRRIARDLVYRHVFRSAAGVLAVGARAALDFEQLGVERGRIHAAMYPGPRKTCPYRPPAARRDVVYCGRLLELKGLDVLADALITLARRRADVGLVVVGDGPCRAPISRARAAGVRVMSHGAVPSERVPELLGSASALALPTARRDGWGYVVNEALAVGLPVVASDAVGAGELVVPGRTGEVFRSGDPGALADAILSALRLHDQADSLATSFAVAQRALDPERFTAYFVSALGAILTSRAGLWPPWLEAAEELGGNTETRWWRSWRGDAPGS